MGGPSETSYPCIKDSEIFCLDSFGERCQSMSNGGAGAGVGAKVCTSDRSD